VTWSPEHAVACLKEEGLRSVWLVERPGEASRTAKYWPVTLWSAAKHCIGISQPARQLRGARRLAAIGVATPQVVDGPTVVSARSRRLYRLELEYVPGSTVMECLEESSHDTATCRSVARQLGVVIRLISGAGLLHRDLRLSNVIVEAAADGPVVWVIDPVGVRRCGNGLMAIARMLERLDVELRRRRAIARGAWREVVRSALSELSAADRRAVFAQLRAHRRS
tara:strand:- start:20340 stop:21011 length:672 start_codon:yes stop_codon:yes gene_type:complete